MLPKLKSSTVNACAFVSHVIVDVLFLYKNDQILTVLKWQCNTEALLYLHYNANCIAVILVTQVIPNNCEQYLTKFNEICLQNLCFVNDLERKLISAPCCH